MTEIEKLEKKIKDFEYEKEGNIRNIEKKQHHVEWIENKIEELKQQIEDLKAEDSVWKPKIRETYYCICQEDICQEEIIESHNDLCKIDEKRYVIGNCFKTKEEAEKVKRHLITKAKLQRIADRLNKGQVIDWEDKDQVKFYLIYNFETNSIIYSNYCYTKIQGTIYCLDANFKDIAIKEIGQEELEKYLKRRIEKNKK